MSRLPLATAAAITLAATSLQAQGTTADSLARRPAAPPAAASVPVDSALRDIERAVAALATTVQGVVTQTANNPEVRLAAVRVAGQAVGLAQQAVTQNTSEIERLLAEASRLLAAAELAQKRKIAAP
jgi:hypothetical protein